MTDLKNDKPDQEIFEEKTQAAKNEKKEKMSSSQQVLGCVHDLIFTMAIVMVIFLLFFRVLVVEGPSMNDTLMSGDYLLLLSRVFYQEPKQGDIVVASMEHFSAGEPIVKRVIATEGQTVDIDFNLGVVYVDGTALTEPYTRTPTTRFEGIKFPLTVTEGHVFLMGDNRENSMDSRDPSIGLVDKREIMGRVLFMLFPGTNKGAVPKDFGRIGVVS